MAVVFAAAAAETDCHMGSRSIVAGVAVADRKGCEKSAAAGVVVAVVAAAGNMGSLVASALAVAAMVAAVHRDYFAAPVEFVAD